MPTDILTSGPSFREQHLTYGLRWLVYLRWVGIVGLILALSLGKYVLNINIPYLNLWIITLIVAVYNTVFGFWGRRAEKRLGSGEVFLRHVNAAITIQIVADLILLTWALHFTGGVENPMLVFYIFHVIIVVTLFRRSAAYLLALLGFGLASLLLWLEAAGIIPHYNIGLLPVELYQNNSYIFWVVSILGITLFSAAYMASGIVQRLREREQELDETRQKLWEETRRCELSYSELDKVHQEKLAFMHKVAHELRAPLAAMRSCLQVAQEYYPEEVAGKARDMVCRAERRAGGLSALVRDLLNLSRATAIPKSAYNQRVQLDALLLGVIELCRPKAQEEEIAISTNITPEVEVSADPQGLEEVFTNLLSNAIKYSPQQTAVTVSLELTSEEVLISFSDQGIGISPQDMELLFTEFFRANNAKSRHVEGTGLGLTISKKIVEAHGGKITVSSQIGEGSCFEVHLPL